METTTLTYAKKEQQKKVNQPKWKRVILLSVIGYEAAGCISGGGLLGAKPDGRLMDMPVEITQGAFRDFLFPALSSLDWES